MKDESGMMEASMPGMADLQKKKDEMRAEFRVTLPERARVRQRRARRQNGLVAGRAGEVQGQRPSSPTSWA
jgi:hypothetical protein